MESEKRSRRVTETADDQRKVSTPPSSYLLNTLRPIQTDVDKYPGFYIFQESLFGNVILPVLPRVEASSK
ncbi:hypothetical protein EG68_07780 [Paragonimus skrjabini miyazakii]|uniref:Uncharacterized protein n=1 Tax=Paragonimus skrjabini miyazakii TaxID=59628 RepID=A0A8S9YUI5_9TREM|nr:hypothetical protein EG68_07780 [Paragonimus skrjabini miyazakii]